VRSFTQLQIYHIYDKVAFVFAFPPVADIVNYVVVCACGELCERSMSVKPVISRTVVASVVLVLTLIQQSARHLVTRRGT